MGREIIHPHYHAGLWVDIETLMAADDEENNTCSF